MMRLASDSLSATLSVSVPLPFSQTAPHCSHIVLHRTSLILSSPPLPCSLSSLPCSAPPLASSPPPSCCTFFSTICWSWRWRNRFPSSALLSFYVVGAYGQCTSYDQSMTSYWWLDLGQNITFNTASLWRSLAAVITAVTTSCDHEPQSFHICAAACKHILYNCICQPFISCRQFECMWLHLLYDCTANHFVYGHRLKV